jgi:hypothetical protein
MKVELLVKGYNHYEIVNTLHPYIVEIDIDRHEIEVTESDRFKAGPLRVFVIKHVNNGVEQKWTVLSKTLVRQLMTEIRKGFKVMEIQRVGEDRSTTYTVEGIQ